MSVLLGRQQVANESWGISAVSVHQFTVLVFMEAGVLQIQIYSAVTLTN